MPSVAYQFRRLHNPLTIIGAALVAMCRGFSYIGPYLGE